MTKCIPEAIEIEGQAKAAVLGGAGYGWFCLGRGRRVCVLQPRRYGCVRNQIRRRPAKAMFVRIQRWVAERKSNIEVKSKYRHLGLGHFYNSRHPRFYVFQDSQRVSLCVMNQAQHRRPGPLQIAVQNRRTNVFMK